MESRKRCLHVIEGLPKSRQPWVNNVWESLQELRSHLGTRHLRSTGNYFFAQPLHYMKTLLPSNMIFVIGALPPVIQTPEHVAPTAEHHGLNKNRNRTNHLQQQPWVDLPRMMGVLSPGSTRCVAGALRKVGISCICYGVCI